MKKGIQICIMIFLVLIILGGGFYILLALEVIPQPAFISSIPVIGSHLGADPETDAEPVEKQTTPKETADNDSKKEKEVEELKLKLDALQKKLEQSEKTEALQQKKIEELSAENDRLKSTEMEAGQSEASKDLAEYYAEMKTKDAAAILACLRDEEFISIIQYMPKDTAAEILQNLETTRAAEITRKMMAANSNG